MKIGAHVSSSGGMQKAFDRGEAIGSECIQIFPSSPQGWAFKSPTEEHIAEFKKGAQRTGIEPIVFHGIYLINLGTTNQENLDKGIDSLVKYLTLAEQVGAQGVLFHVGSHKGVGYERIFSQVVMSLEKILDASPTGPWLAIENSAGIGNQLGATFEEIGQIINALGTTRMKLCFDTQHAFAAGYPIDQEMGLDATLDQLDTHIGLERLVAVHANDSKTSFGSGKDRHENIGDGQIGVQGFETILAHESFKDIPFYLEVPGIESKGPDVQNIDRLKRIRDKVR